MHKAFFSPSAKSNDISEKGREEAEHNNGECNGLHNQHQLFADKKILCVMPCVDCATLITMVLLRKTQKCGLRNTDECSKVNFVLRLLHILHYIR